MMNPFRETKAKSLISGVILYFWLVLGAFIAGFAIQGFFIPNELIDGGIVGIAMIFSYLFGQSFLPWLIVLFNMPFIFLGLRSIGKAFLIHMLVAVIFFASAVLFTEHVLQFQFKGESLEFVVIGGALLGIGLGLIIRSGGCIDGTEVLGIILNKRLGFTVGQIVLVCNVFVFGAAGFVFQNWHPPLLSLITYMIVIKVMDAVIVGLDETKSVIIISHKSKEIAAAIMHELGLGLTVMYGRGGFSGDEREILYVIAERLQLHDLKELVFREDTRAFIAIENLHEVANGVGVNGLKKSRVERIVKKILNPK